MCARVFSVISHIAVASSVIVMTEAVLVHLIQLAVPSAQENKGTDCAFACTKHDIYVYRCTLPAQLASEQV